ncbi:hypothetical protein BV25DRAFT_1895786 [Artomyces pyxidatus]|uniref:Uncharacterized protein n=1 Tax=Artomyces pyxidatus TaxID=48021 RepID=A0ACB8TJF6_9AGAM|nr:hypothetical protein BV25DRAFT_1895786 [Artomyces pyxidatus]
MTPGHVILLDPRDRRLGPATARRRQRRRRQARLSCPTVPMSSSIAFPTTETRTHSFRSDVSSAISRNITAFEVCDLVYGQTSPSSWAALERFYEASAGTYESPLITATSRGQIGDLFGLAQHLATLDLPRPSALLRALLGAADPDAAATPWLRVARTWTDIEEVCESESFDGHRRCIVEHTLHILLLPGLPAADAWHPLHLQLRVLSRLAFNEQGRITHHRDAWDVAELVRLLPGGALAQWAASRATAAALALAARTLRLGGARTPGKRERRRRAAWWSGGEGGRVWGHVGCGVLGQPAAYGVATCKTQSRQRERAGVGNAVAQEGRPGFPGDDVLPLAGGITSRLVVGECPRPRVRYSIHLHAVLQRTLFSPSSQSRHPFQGPHQPAPRKSAMRHAKPNVIFQRRIQFIGIRNF